MVAAPRNDMTYITMTDDFIDAIDVPLIVATPSGYVRKLNAATKRLLPDGILSANNGSLQLWDLSADSASRQLLQSLDLQDSATSHPSEITWAIGDDTLMTWTVRRVESPQGISQVVYTGVKRHAPQTSDTFNLVADYAPVMMWHEDRENDTIRFNERFQRFIGIDAAQHDQAPITWEDVIHPDSFQRREMLLEVAAAQNEPFRIEYQIRSYDGAYFWVRDEGEPILKDGELVGFLGVTVFIHDMREAIDELLGAQVHFRAVTQTAGDAIITCESDASVILWNEAAELIFGYSSYEMMGRPIWDIMPARFQQEHQEIMESLVNTLTTPQADSTINLEMVGETKDGHELPIEVTLTVWSAGDVPYSTFIIRDISQRKRVMEKLRQFYHAVESSPTSVVITDLKGDIQYVNPMFTELTGYLPEEAIGQNPRILKSGLTPPEVYGDMWRTIKDGKLWRGEIVNKKKDGSLYWELALISPLADEEGAVSHYVAIKEDITERKQIEQALMNSQQRLSDIVHNNVDGMVVVDLDGIVQFVNPTAAGWFQTSAEQFIGRAFAVDANIDHMTELELVSSAGEPIDVEMRVAQMEWDNQPARLIALRDVTQRKNVEAALRQSEANLRSIFDNSTISYVLIEPSYKVRAVNAVIQKRTQLDFGNVIQPGMNFLDFVPPGARDEFEQSIAQALNGDIVTLEKSHQDPGGTVTWDEVRYYPVSADDKRVLGVFMSIEDITERKAATQRTIQLHVEQQRVRILTDFIRDASHEFRTPLTIINTSSMLIDRIEDPERRSEKTSNIQAQVSRINRLLDDLLLVSTLDSGVALEMSQVNVNNMLLALTEDVSVDDHAEIHLAFDDTLPVILGDSSKLVEAFDRVVYNALRYTPREGSITIQTRAKSEYVQVTISDSGKGMDDEVLAHAFDHFFRQDDAHTTSGFGLGLPIARQIIEMHGGTIDLQSKPGAGTTVTIRLPTTAPQPATNLLPPSHDD